MSAFSGQLAVVAPAMVAGFIVLLSHVPLGIQVLNRGIVFIDLAIAQVAALGVVLAGTLGFGTGGWPAQIAAVLAALLAALLLTFTERRRPDVQEALIGVLFVLASTAEILLLANDPHGGEDLKDLLAGQILWVSWAQLARAALMTLVFLILWFRWRERLGRAGFYLLFALMVTASVQMVGVYLVFTSLIVPALATSRMPERRRLLLGYLLSVLSYAAGLLLSLQFDLPASALIVWCLAVAGFTLQYAAGERRSPHRTSAASGL